MPPAILRRLAAACAVPPPPPPAAWNAPPEGRDEAGQIEFSWASETARHVGTVVHRWLQRIAEDELKGWDAKRVAGLRAAVRGDLARRGVASAELDQAGERVLAALRNSISDDKGRWVLGPHRHAFTEKRICAMVNGAFRRMVMDRVFEDSSGRHWIVDYKTSAHEGADRDAFLDRERDRYAPQLKLYASAMAGSDPGTGLYFPLLAGWRELR